MGERVPCCSCHVTRIWVDDFPAVATAMCAKCRKRILDDFAIASAERAVIEMAKAYVMDAGYGGRLVRAVRALEDAEKAREGR